jgi:hypothetical protein
VGLPGTVVGTTARTAVLNIATRIRSSKLKGIFPMLLSIPNIIPPYESLCVSHPIYYLLRYKFNLHNNDDFEMAHNNFAKIFIILMIIEFRGFNLLPMDKNTYNLMLFIFVLALFIGATVQYSEGSMFIGILLMLAALFILTRIKLEKARQALSFYESNHCCEIKV